MSKSSVAPTPNLRNKIPAPATFALTIVPPVLAVFAAKIVTVTRLAATALGVLVPDPAGVNPMTRTTIPGASTAGVVVVICACVDASSAMNQPNQAKSPSEIATDTITLVMLPLAKMA